VKLTISEAARRAGVRRTAIYRKRDAGKLSRDTDRDGNPVIDLSELTRRYPHAVTDPGQRRDVPRTFGLGQDETTNSGQKCIIATSRSGARRSAMWAALALFFIAPSAHANPHAGKRLQRLVETIQAQAPNIGTKAILTAINAYFHVKWRHLTDKPLITIVDYSLPSTKRRLAVADVQTGKVLFYTYVAQGKGSGLKYATRFSNKPGTDASSLGVYLTGHTYYGKHGYSLRLHGLDPEFNGAAYRRDIVIHSAWYVSKTFAQEHGYMGRSWGCFALSHKVESAIVRLIRGDTVLVGYYPDPKWLHSSPFLIGLPAASMQKFMVTAAGAL
jgi:hypothetical protein